VFQGQTATFWAATLRHPERQNANASLLGQPAESDFTAESDRSVHVKLFSSADSPGCPHGLSFCPIWRSVLAVAVHSMFATYRTTGRSLGCVGLIDREHFARLRTAGQCRCTDDAR
jgi:hypothetical protein